MKDYFKKTEYVLERLWFDYLGSRYQGRGIMTWTPEKGFHIEAFLEKPNTLPPKKIEFGKIGIVRKSDICTIRMKPQGFDWAIAPKVHLIDRNDVLFNNRLSIDLDLVIFSESGAISNKDSYWRGSALYETKSKLHLSDVVHSEVRINGLPEFLIPNEQTLALQKQLVEAKTAHERTMILRQFSDLEAQQRNKPTDRPS